MRNGLLTMGILAVVLPATIGAVVLAKSHAAPASTEMHAHGEAAAMPGQTCMAAMDGPAKAKHEAYMKDTAGVRKDLADARAALGDELSKEQVDRATVNRLVTSVNDLQGRLYSKTVDFYLSVRGSMPADKMCRANPVSCTMMMSDQCPMMGHGAGGMAPMGSGGTEMPAGMAGCCSMGGPAGAKAGSTEHSHH
ncbi:MAG: periplasmic heavy metal sensor [Armatimonadetes bacterium]|nr:periplasmic heavy metal sensor [Armatimonadota bacterium]